MADNYIDVPICVVRAYANGAITVGSFVKAGSAGFDVSDAAHDALGAVAVAAAAGSDYFPLCICGVVKARAAAAWYAGDGLIFSDTAGILTPVADTNLMARCVGTAIDYAADSTSTRSKRVWLLFTPRAQDSANQHY